MIQVPYSRVVKPDAIGADVLGYKRALSRAAPDLYPWPEKGHSTFYGPFAIQAVKELQKRHKIQQTGNIGPVTHTLLEGLKAKGKPGEWAFDARAIQLLTQYYDAHHISPEQRIHNTMLDFMQWVYSQRMGMGYNQFRPFPLFKLGGQIPGRLDCSGWQTNVQFAGGAPNPNARAWDGLGYTGTLMLTGSRCSILDMEIGDPVFYGFTPRHRATGAFPTGSPTHVAPFAGGGRVYSMGSFPMGYYDWDYRGVNHCRHYNVVK